MKKRIAAMTVALAMVLGVTAAAAGGEKSITVTPMGMTINGQAVTPTKSDGRAAQVFAYDGATYVPLRYLSELLGIEVQWDKNDPNTARLVSDKLTVPAGGNGTYTGTGMGFGGQITANITLGGGRIIACTLTGPEETPAIGGAALPELEKQVAAAGSADIDGVSGASVTSGGVKSAVAAALSAAGSGTSSGVRMAPGTYTGEAWGFNRVEKVKAAVTVSESAMLSIDVDLSNIYETSIKLRNAAELMVPRMLEGQSVAVDTVTGATGSSAAIRAAVTDALQQAIAAAGGNAGEVSAFQKVNRPAAKEETLDTDVLIVGMGGSGSYASLRVAELLHEKEPGNVNVLAIDKAGNYGGTTVLTGEALAVNPPKLQAQRNGEKDYVDADVFFKDWLNYTEGDAKNEMVTMMVRRSGEALDWLGENGFYFEDPQEGLGDGTTDAPPFLVKYRFGPVDDNGYLSKDAFQACFDSLYRQFNEYGGKYLLETEATGLLTDVGGNVVGAVAYNKVTNTTYTIKAKAVIVATGGFAGSGELSGKYLGQNEMYPLGGKWNVCGSTQNDGKMIQAAIDVGAGTYNIDMTPVCHLFGPDGWLTSYPNVAIEGANTVYWNRPAYWSEGDLPMMLCFWPKTFAVNALGKRFLPESNLASFDAWKGGPDISVIVTEAQVKDIAVNGIDVDDTSMHLLLNMDIMNNKAPIPRGTVLPNAVQVMEDGVKAGFISKANTVEELAVELGLDPAVLKAELDKYNKGCKTGKDELGKSAEYLVAMEKGPYYAIHAGMYAYGTCAGLDINEDFQVLRTDGKTPIGGLYAVGADGQGVVYSPKKAYVTYGGADNGWALMSGYVAGGKVVEGLDR